MTWLKILLMWSIMFLQVIFVATNRNFKGYTEMKFKSKYHKLIIKIKKDGKLFEEIKLIKENEIKTTKLH